ncbi:MAG: phage minor head protein [Cytophagales bacterium]|nr:phage minor head protein [Cytophagales bacterium]
MCIPLTLAKKKNEKSLPDWEEEGLLFRIYKDGVKGISVTAIYNNAKKYDKVFVDALGKDIPLKTSLDLVPLSVQWRREIASFSGLKTISKIKKLGKELPKHATFSSYKKAVKPLLQNINIHHLSSEFRLAQQSTRGAFQYEKEVQNDRYPNWRYSTVGDERVRPEHADLDGVTYPKDDPFWDEAFPPNGWNCRCKTVAIKGTGRPAPKAVRNGIPEEFRFNPAKIQKIPMDKRLYSRSDYVEGRKASGKLMNREIKTQAKLSATKRSIRAAIAQYRETDWKRYVAWIVLTRIDEYVAYKKWDRVRDRISGPFGEYKVSVNLGTYKINIKKSRKT